QLSYANERPEVGPIAETLRSTFAQAGIRVDLAKGPESVLVSRAIGTHDIPLYLTDTGSPVIPDGSNLTGFWLRGAAANVTNYFTPVFIRLHTLVTSTLGDARRAAAFYEAQRILAFDLPVIPIVTYRESIAMKKSIDGYAWAPDHTTHFAPLKIT